MLFALRSFLTSNDLKFLILIYLSAERNQTVAVVPILENFSVRQTQSRDKKIFCVVIFFIAVLRKIFSLDRADAIVYAQRAKGEFSSPSAFLR